MRLKRPVRVFASTIAASALALAGVGCASDEVERTRPLDDSEKAAIEDRAEGHQEDLEVNIDKERDR